MAEQVRRTADDLLQERDGIGGHPVEGDRSADVGGPSLAAPVEAVAAEVGGQPVEVGIPGAGVRSARVQQHQRVAGAVGVPPGLDPAHSLQLGHVVRIQSHL